MAEYYYYKHIHCSQHGDNCMHAAVVLDSYYYSLLYIIPLSSVKTVIITNAVAIIQIKYHITILMKAVSYTHLTLPTKA